MQATPLHVPQRLARRLWHSLLGSLGLLLLAAPVLLILSVLSFRSGADEKPAKLPAKAALTVSTVKPESADWPQFVAASGNVSAWQEAIVGSEIPLTRHTGKGKLGQNRSTQHQASMAHGLALDEQPGAARALGALHTANVTSAS